MSLFRCNGPLRCGIPLADTTRSHHNESNGHIANDALLAASFSVSAYDHTAYYRKLQAPGGGRRAMHGTRTISRRVNTTPVGIFRRTLQYKDLALLDADR